MKYERGSFIVVPSREKLRGLPVPAQALYMWLCAYANETGECYPSRARLAKDCDCSLNTVDRFTQLLVDRGLMTVEKRFKNNEQMTNLYSLIIWEGGSPTDAPPPSPKSEQGVAPQKETELNPILTKESESEIRVVSYLKENTDTEPTSTRDGYEIGYKELCEWAEKRRGAKFLALKKQYKSLKKARVNNIGPSQLKKRWIELEGDDWRDGLDWASVISSFDKRPIKK